MTSLITAKFRNTAAQEFLDSFSANTSYYMFAAKSKPYPLNDDVESLTLVDNESQHIQTYKDMIFGKRVANTDVAIMATRYDWTPNTVFDAYSDTKNLFSLKFYSLVNEANTYHLYKCLDNNQGAASTEQPTFSETAANDVYYATSDGYQWKYISTISTATFNKFATSDYIPLVVNANVSGNAITGAIDTIRVVEPGTNYNNFLYDKTFNSTDIKIGGIDTLYTIDASASAVNDFYNDSLLIIVDGTGVGQWKKITDYSVIGSDKLVTILTPFDTIPDATSKYEISPSVLIIGDGQQTTNAEARAIINASSSNSVSRIEILNRGRNYFYASAEVVNSPLINIFSPAEVVAAIGPVGGHGANLYSELNGRYVGISTSFSNTEADTIDASNGFRQIGLLKNPLFSNVVLSIESTDLSPGSNGTFVVGESVLQDNTGAMGVVSAVSAGNLSITSVSGIVANGNTTVRVMRGLTSNAYAVVNGINNNGVVKGFNTFERTFRYIGVNLSGHFTPNELLITANSLVTNSSIANANFFSESTDGGTTTIRTTDQYGLFNLGETLIGTNSGASMIISTKYIPDIKFNSGQILCIEGFNEITRSNTTTEKFNLILEF
jgi:hypothetical protein